MAGSTYGSYFRITTWGESHGKGVGVVVDGCPAGLPLCEENIQKYLNRRKPGQNPTVLPARKTMLWKSSPASLKGTPPAPPSL